jgi:hypothetical protein
MKTLFLALFLCIALSIAPSGANDGPKKPDFLIDPSKDYVYLKFDHVGDREPLTPDEPTKGLWLRLVNNCRIPIVVAIFDTGTVNAGVGVFDEVVPLAAKRPLPVFHLPGRAKSEPKPAPVQEEPPEGYSPPDVFSTTIISPRENLLFSVPLNHIGPSWYLQIRFYFELPGGGYGSGPYSVVSFDWQDIPEKFRAPGAAPVSSEPTTR